MSARLQSLVLACLGFAILLAACEIAGQRVYLCPAEGPSLAEDRNLSDVIGELFGDGARFVAIPLERLGPDFLRLASGVLRFWFSVLRFPLRRS